MNRPIQIGFVLVALAMAGRLVPAALAADADPGIYGQLDLAKFPKPKLIYDRPVIADAAARKTKAKPIYLHVPPGHEWHWNAHCRTYNACNVPVHFVSENWFVNVYLPAIGSRDGREQRYRIEAGRDREVRREYHDVHGED